MPQDSQSLVSKIGNWFRRGNRPLNGELLDAQQSDRPQLELRGSVLRPWAKRDQAISNLQDGFQTLTELMTAIKENLNDQSRRQDELLRHLAHLPEAIQSIPESNRMQGEALRAIHARMEHQNEQQQMIAEILHKVSQSSSEQSKTVDVVRDRVEVMAEHERKIADNLSSVGTAMQTVSRNSQTSAQVLEQMRDNISSRDGQLERILHKQAMRFTSMLAVAIFLSIAALVAVAVVGYQLLNKTPPNSQPTPPASVQHLP
jgi:chromosome segregation ATPase